nr:DNA polymerase III subunit beta [Rhizobium sp. Q54]
MVTHVGYQSLKGGSIFGKKFRLWQRNGVCGNFNSMKRSEAIEKLRAQADAIRARGATSLYLFGSVARDEAGETSDLDLFIDYDASKKFSLVDLVGIKIYLEDELSTEVDVTTRDSLHPLLKDKIETSAIRIF